MQVKTELKIDSRNSKIKEKKKGSRKSSQVLSEYLSSNVVESKNSDRKKKRKLVELSGMAEENIPRGFYTPTLGTQAKAEKPANSNGESEAKDSSAYSRQNEEAGARYGEEGKKDKNFSRNKSGISGSDKQSFMNRSQGGDEAEKVEESLRDFIGKIIGYYEKFNVGNSLLGKYEKKISQAETLLEVFDLMKEMFEELMQNVLKESRGLLDCSDISDTEIKGKELDKLIHQYEKEIRTMANREKELVRLAGIMEKGIGSKEKELTMMKNKYDEVRKQYCSSN